MFFINILLILFFLISIILIIDFIIYLIKLYLQVYLLVFKNVYNHFLSFLNNYILSSLYMYKYLPMKKNSFFLYIQLIIRTFYFTFIVYVNISIFIFLLYNYMYLNIILSILFIFKLDIDKCIICFKKSVLICLILYFLGWFCFIFIYNWRLVLNFIHFLQDEYNKNDKYIKNYLELFDFIFLCLYYFSINIVNSYYNACLEIKKMITNSNDNIFHINIKMSYLLILLSICIYIIVTTLIIRNYASIFNIDLFTYILSNLKIIHVTDYTIPHRNILSEYIKEMLYVLTLKIFINIMNNFYIKKIFILLILLICIHIFF